MSEEFTERDLTAIDTIRFLSVDMVEAANSGHPGAPLGLAPLAYLLWTKTLRVDPSRPDWPNRDRFVLSAGHASALLYSLLHLAGFDLPEEELRNFRQLGSKTPGHPENFVTQGIETTTGPLGQGVGNAVGMAIAERMLADRFNRDGFDLFDHRTWVIASDGDLMEGVAAEASSLAGHLGLGKLKVFYDDNQITIDGSTDISFTEDVAARYEAYGWRVLRVEDGNDLPALAAAIDAAEAETERPVLVAVRTVIGYGSPDKAGTSSAHGSPLGEEETIETKKNLCWPVEPPFLVPAKAREAFDGFRSRGAELASAWADLLERYGDAHPEAAAELERRRRSGDGELPTGWTDHLPTFETGASLATRKASGKVLNALAPHLPELTGGSADLAGSNNTTIDGEPFLTSGTVGRNMHFGVREHAMGSIANGMALSGLLRPYCGTFLIFSDYMRPAVRLAALMDLPVTYVFTHDSIFLGEDGPTHQPIAQLASLRAIPNVAVVRPADARETAQGWRVALERQGPTVLSLTRQGLPVLDETADGRAEGVLRGAYVLADSPSEGATPDVILLATGSEVQVALEARRLLAERGVGARVVSMPCWELFEAQTEAYRRQVLPPDVRHRLAIEAGASFGWHRWVGLDGDVLTIDRFGASAPWKDLAEHFGFTAEEAVRRVEALLA